MSNSVTPKLAKWPFLLGDLLLVSLAVLIVNRSSVPINFWHGFLSILATAAGAWLCAAPFLWEYRTAAKLTEAEALASTVAQIGNLQDIKAQITEATAQWHSLREHSTQTVAAAKEINDRMKGQLAEFCAFLQSANDSEKNHLRLQVEKLRRGERDWLQTTVHVLDHVFALHTAASRSEHPALGAQLNQFQSACRDAVRRLGLLSFAPALNDPFDPQTHQLADNQSAAGDSMCISEILALGYTYQGELVRRALVRVQPAVAVAEESTAASITTAAS